MKRWVLFFLSLMVLSGCTMHSHPIRGGFYASNYPPPPPPPVVYSQPAIVYAPAPPPQVVYQQAPVYYPSYPPPQQTVIVQRVPARPSVEVDVRARARVGVGRNRGGYYSPPPPPPQRRQYAQPVQGCGYGGRECGYGYGQPSQRRGRR